MSESVGCNYLSEKQKELLEGEPEITIYGGTCPTKTAPTYIQPIGKDGVELDYLRWFFANADFGPADDDVRQYLNKQYVEETGNQIPEGY